MTISSKGKRLAMTWGEYNQLLIGLYLFYKMTGVTRENQENYTVRFSQFPETVQMPVID